MGQGFGVRKFVSQSIPFLNAKGYHKKSPARQFFWPLILHPISAVTF